MRRVLKSIILWLRPALIFVCGLFFDRKYLTGRHFTKSLYGFIWAFRSAWARNILRLAKPLPWPAVFSCYVSNPKNIFFHPDDLNNFQSPGTYFQNFSGCIYIGRGSYIAPNVGIITTNHNVDNLDTHDNGKDVVIGNRCWIGMNAVILPGVVLGDRTIVAAGAVVSKSFPEGHVVIGGVPAKVLRNL